MPVRMMQAEEFRQFFSTMLTDEGFRGECTESLY